MKKLFLGAVLALSSGSLSAFSYTLELSEAELQVKAESMMPIEKKKLFITTVFSNPVVDLIASSNQIGLSTDVQVSALGDIASSGNVMLTGSLRYDSDTGSFYFENMSIKSLQIDKLPSKSAAKIKKVLEKLAQKFLSANPVYQFRDDDLKHKLAKSSLKSIRVENETLFVELGLF